jgi:hypothetical protein
MSKNDERFAALNYPNRLLPFILGIRSLLSNFLH